MKTLPTGFFTLFLLTTVVTHSTAQPVPSLINYQGVLSDPTGTNLVTTNYAVSFYIFDNQSGQGAPTWGPQVFDGGSAPGHGQKVAVVNGYFNVILGDADTNGVSIANAFSGPPRW